MRSKTFLGAASIVTALACTLLTVYSHMTDRAWSGDGNREVIHSMPMEPLIVYAPEYDLSEEPAQVKVKVTEIRLSIFDTRINDQIKEADLFNQELDTLLVQLKAE